MTVSSNLTGVGNNVVARDTGSLILAGNNSFGGGLSTDATNPDTAIIVTSPSGLGAGAVTFATRLSNSTATQPVLGFDLGANSSNTFNNNIALDSGMRQKFLSIQTNNSQAVTLAGVISGGSVTGSILFANATNGNTGTFILSNANTFVGATTVANGTLLVNGSTASGSAIGVSSGATFGGTGTVGGATTLNAGSRLAPGAGGVGTLNVANGVTINGGTGSTWLIEVNGLLPANADRLALAGAGSNLNLVLSPTSKLTLDIQALGNPAFQVGMPYTYTIATAAAGGNFQRNGGSFFFDPSEFSISSNVPIQNYSLAVSGNELQLTFTPVPDSGHVFLICTAAAGGAWFFRGLSRTNLQLAPNPQSLLTFSDPRGPAPV